MAVGALYRISSVTGTALLTLVSILVANSRLLQTTLTMNVPVFTRLTPTTLTDGQLYLALLTTLLVVLGVSFPLFEPRPRRTAELVVESQRRVGVACLVLATLGYFDYTYPMPRTTLLATTACLLVVLPVWFVALSRHRVETSRRALVVGDDPERIADIVQTSSLPIVGYISPPLVERAVVTPPTASDGGAPSGELRHLGGLSRLEDIVVENDIDTVLLGFGSVDREEFFGAVKECYEHGVTVKVPEEHSDLLLTRHGVDGQALVDVVLQPWDLQDRLLKRGFDVCFAAVGLTILAPFIGLIALAIKLDSPGPVFFSQTRTFRFGDTFQIYKFRTLKPAEGGETGVTIDDSRRTPVGEFLRKTHLDEIPQLWSILVGDMSVVGPRPAQTDLEHEFQTAATEWQQRWFVRPGLTGLAQIRGATSQEPAEKIQYDIEYVKNQSFWFDLHIIAVQIYEVLIDVASLGSKVER